MRNELVTFNSMKMVYEIRKIVGICEALQKYGMTINWENIGDPIVKGEITPTWMKDIVAKEVYDNSSWSYSHTKGMLSTREFLCALTNSRKGAHITAENVIFFNGLGDAISKIYNCLKPQTRIILPSPTYPTHCLGEANHAGALPICYPLNPAENWSPDLEYLENSIKYNPQIGGILLINPDNPTGSVYTKQSLIKIVEIAKRYDLFLISDEIYINIIYNGAYTVPISDVIGDVPAIALKGISKEFPWPGARCGWIEVYNGGKDDEFDRYINSIVTAKMNEVCSTTLPQKVIPQIMSHPSYQSYLKERLACYEKMSTITFDLLSQVEGLTVNRTNGAFYNAVTFKKGILKETQTLPLINSDIKQLIEKLVQDPTTSLDKRFVYYMLAHTGICVVPLSSFFTHLQGFRVTLLEKDENKCRAIYNLLAAKIEEYLAS